mmetsp:Transcript_11923/g.31516  ORF Transcript_11923/g.31516 Transcript_11923/m.31516 type:complete len:252 (-) Transcript_11923:344-1099(-)
MAPPHQETLAHVGDADVFDVDSKEKSKDPPPRLQSWLSNASTEDENDIVTELLSLSSLYQLPFAATIADPAVGGCPIVACSKGFCNLTGYSTRDVLGRDCSFLLDGVPEDAIDEEMRSKASAFLSAAGQEPAFSDSDDDATDAWSPRSPTKERPAAASLEGMLAEGEIMCVQTHARQNAELFRTMSYLREVELNDVTFILSIQTELDRNMVLDYTSAACLREFVALYKSMDELESVLAKRFWLSGSLRRRV